MTTNRRGPAPTQRRLDGRHIRFSWRYQTFQVKTKQGQWVNVRHELARAYAAAGFPVEAAEVVAQGDLF